jgi:NADPH:quinone reductase-like Zn-dependent oxidoreductase
VLEVVTLPVGEPAAGEIRIRVAAAAVNPTDLMLRSGEVAAYVSAFTAPFVPGMDVSGTVDAVGPDAGWRVGDRVMAMVNPFRAEGGGQAEYVVVPADSVARMPDGLSPEAAATLPMNGLTAVQAVELVDLPVGATLAVTGSAGVLGGYVVQLAKNAGLRVVADTAEGMEFGADVLVPRGTLPSEVDGLIDAAVLGAAALPAVRAGGRFVKVRPYEFETERGIEVRAANVLGYEDRQVALEKIALLAEKGVLTPRVAGTYPAECAGDAHRRLEAGGVRGRLVLVFF